MLLYVAVVLFYTNMLIHHDVFDNRLIHQAKFYQMVPKLE